MENMSTAVNTSRLKTIGLRVTAFRGGLTGPLTTDAPKLVQNLFLLFVFTIPFEAIDLGFMSGSLSLAKIPGFLFFASYCFYYSFLSPRRSFPCFPSAMWWFAAYVAVYALNGLFISEELIGPFITRLLTLLQLIALFWLASSSFREERITRNIIVTFALASVVLSLGNLLEFPGFSVVDSDRVSSLGHNPNTLAAIMAVSVLSIIGMTIVYKFRSPLRRIMFLGLAFPPLAVVVMTGSRGGMLALMLGLSLYILPCGAPKRLTTRLVVACLAAVAVAYAIANDSVALSRWTATFEEGSLAGRERIYPVAAEMILERPLFGWGPFEMFYELGRRTRRLWKTMDAHNLLLHLGLEVGAAGTVPFLVGLWLCTRAAWRARAGKLGLLPLSLMVATLAVNMSGTGLGRKFTWLIFALALGAGGKPQIRRT